ncbi:MAG: DUF4192 domain-containing protein [Dermatophilaceae bacterium]
MTTTITLRGPGEVAAFLPYQLGYHPTDSVVVVTLVGGVVGMVARVDIPDQQDVAYAAESVVGPVLDQHPTHVTLVGYEGEVAGSSAPLLRDLVERFGGAQVEVVDALVVHAGRFASLLCSEACCGPGGGQPVPAPEDVPAVVGMVMGGRSPLASRAALDRAVEADSAAGEVGSLVRQRALLAEVTRRGRSARAWARILGRSPQEAGPRAPLRPVDVADAALGLTDLPWRDGLLARLASGSLPTAAVAPEVLALVDRRLPSWCADVRSRDAVIARLLRVCRSVPDDCPAEAAAICTVTAHLVWIGGDGAQARAGVSRALRLVPDYRLGLLLLRLLDSATAPPAPRSARSIDSGSTNARANRAG